MRADHSDFFHSIADIETRMGLSMRTVTSFHIGGPADVIFPKNDDELLRVMIAAKQSNTPLIVLGNGTNVLVRDEGIDMPVLMLNRYIQEARWRECEVTVSAGMLLSVLSKESVKRGYSGLEWANGIPGTVGGAIAMNAGAYGGEVKNVLTRLRYIEDCEIFERQPLDGELGYRKSAFCAPERICVGATFKLQEDDGSAEERLKEFAQRRIAKQPLKYPSAGSVFKRPEGHFAGALIEKAGLKGKRVGGAKVSELHAGFIINTGNATCDEVLELIKIIQDRVYENSGVKMDTEIKLIGSEAGN